MAPLLRRTWSPCGQTPVLLQRTRSHQKVSVIAAIGVAPKRNKVQLFFRLHPNRNIATQQIRAFLRQLLHHLKGNIVLLWDRFNPHRSARIQLFLSQTPRLQVVFFPPYAPELNPTENFWSYLKTNPLANAALPDLPSLIHKTRHHSRSIQRSTTLLRSFVHHSPLSLRLR